MIPKIIHQVWEGKTETLPDFLAVLGETWKYHHPEWQYEFWDKGRMETFVYEHFPEFVGLYFGYQYDVQRWDAIRYLFLYKMGGLYVDFDFECIAPLDKLLHGKKCCFGLDPEGHAKTLKKPFIITNAIMASRPGHSFFYEILTALHRVNSKSTDKFNYVLETTGPYLVTELYNSYPQKEEIDLLPSELTSPWTKAEVQMYLCRKNEDMLNQKLNKALAIHYFWGSWYQATKS